MPGTLRVRREWTLWVGEKQALSLFGAWVHAVSWPEVGGAAGGVGSGGAWNSVGEVVTEDLPGSDAQEAAGCPNPGLRSMKGAGDGISLLLMCLYKRCMGVGVEAPGLWPPH